MADRRAVPETTDVTPSLLQLLRKRGDELEALPEGWDSYGGKPSDPATVDRAIDYAIILAPTLSEPPQLVPSSDGSVQVEWHTDGWDVELWISRAG